MAVPLPAEVRATLDEALSPYRVACPHVRWLRPESWHLTLLFLGSVPSAATAGLISLLDDAAAERQPGVISLAGADGRLQKRGGVAWLQVSRGAARLLTLADRLGQEVASEVGGIVPPKRTPSAHLTVARKVDADVITMLRERRHGSIEASWTSDRMILVRSHLGPDGPRYETLHVARCTLPGKET